jgi:hypothetical protein
MPIRDLTNHLFLWHLTPKAKADRISDRGFLPKGKPRQNQIRRPVWFSTSVYSFIEFVKKHQNPKDHVAFLTAVPIDWLDHTWNGQVPDEFTIHQPLPADVILCRFRSDIASDRKALVKVLERHQGPNLIDQLTDLCTKTDIPWSRRTSPAALLLGLDRSRYESETITAYAFVDGLIDRTWEAAKRDAQDVTTIDFRFSTYFLRHYYFTYGERHLARALLAAAARRIGADRVVDLCIHEDANPRHNPIARFLVDLLPQVSRLDLVFALIELRVMRVKGLSENSIENLEQWLLNSPLSAACAPYFIENGFANFHARYGDVTVDLAARILGAADGDPFHTIQPIAHSIFPDARRGAVRAFGALREERALSFLESCLDTDWKEMRAEAVVALSRLDHPRARNLVSEAQQDKAGKVRRIAEKALAGR